MENKNELSDIILDKDEDKSIKVKRILIIVALMVFVFLIVLVVMRVINKPDNKSNITKLILPTQPISKQVKPKKEDDLFKQVPIVQEENKKESFENMVKSLKEKEIKKQDKIVPKIEKIQKKVKIPIQEKMAVKQVAPIKVKNKIKKVTSKNAKKGVYVQVGATSRLTPNKKFLEQLAKNNYKYKLIPIDLNGKKVTKILIGPYTNINSARKNLAKIKATITKGAFIYRVK